MTTIVIADDHPVVRKGLMEILKGSPDLEVVGEAADAQEVLERLKELKPELLLLDLSMPGATGLELLKDVRQGYPDMSVLVISIHPEDQYAIRVLKAGAAGYIEKDSAPDILVEAIRAVASGRKFVSPTLAERLAEELVAGPARQPHELLSDREYEVMRMIAMGRTPSDTARELNLSVKTINTYRARVLEKMRMRSNAEIIRYAVEHKLVD